MGLFSSGWQSDNPKKRMAFVEKLKSDEAYAAYASAPKVPEDVRLACIARLRGPEGLATVVQAVPEHEAPIWSAALDRIADRDTLTGLVVMLEAKGQSQKVAAIVAKADGQTLLDMAESGCIAAVRRINDPALLVALACGASPVWREAIAGLAAPEDLLRVVEEAKDPHARLFAVGRIADDELLARLAAKTADPDIRLSAVKGIRDQAILFALFANESDGELRKMAIGHMDDPVRLGEIARGGAGAEYRVQAANRYLSLPGLPTAERDGMVADMLAELGPMPMFSVLPQPLWAEYGFERREMTCYPGTGADVFDVLVDVVEYYHHGKRLDAVDI